MFFEYTDCSQIMEGPEEHKLFEHRDREGKVVGYSAYKGRDEKGVATIQYFGNEWEILGKEKYWTEWLDSNENPDQVNYKIDHFEFYDSEGKNLGKKEVYWGGKRSKLHSRKSPVRSNLNKYVMTKYYDAKGNLTRRSVLVQTIDKVVLMDSDKKENIKMSFVSPELLKTEFNPDRKKTTKGEVISYAISPGRKDTISKLRSILADNSLSPEEKKAQRRSIAQEYEFLESFLRFRRG